MRAFPNTVSISSTTETALVANEEKVILTTPPIATQSEGGVIIFDGSLSCAVGVGATSFHIRIRRTSLLGVAIVDYQGVTVVASTQVSFPFNAQDAPGEVAGQIYVVTATVAGGAGTMKLAVANLSY